MTRLNRNKVVEILRLTSCELLVVTKVTEHIWRDCEMIRRHGIIIVEMMQAFGVGKITFCDVPRVPVNWDVHQIKVCNFLFCEETKISYTDSGALIAPPYKLFATEYKIKLVGSEGSYPFTRGLLARA